MGLLSDVYSYGDTLKRKLSDAVRNPRASLEQFVGQLSDNQRRQSGLMNQAGWLPIDRAYYSPEQREAARRQLADEGTNMALGAATVYHGSPHRFDKFDSSKIGTGEGAQAYGYGLYLADSPDVAKGYRDAGFAAYPKVVVGGKDYSEKLGDAIPDAMDVHEMLGTKYGTVSGENAKELALRYVKDKALAAELKAVPADKFKVSLSEGNLYKVDLPDEQITKMLDWDKTMSAQSPEALSAFNRSEIGKRILTTFRANGMENRLSSTTFGNALKMLRGGTESEAALQMKMAGIPGIRFLDGNSRRAGTGSSNYVVFPGNEGVLTIMERNGTPLRDTTWEPPLFPDTAR